MEFIANNADLKNKIIHLQKDFFLKSKKKLFVVQIYLVLYLALAINNLHNPIYIFNYSMNWVYGIFIISLIYRFRNALFDYRFNKIMLQSFINTKAE